MEGLEHVGQFLERISAQAACRILQDEMAVVLHVVQPCAELSLLVAVSVEAVFPEKGLAVVFAHDAHLPLLEQAVVGFEMLQDVFQHMATLAVHAAHLQDGGRIGRIAAKLRLVDVQPDADDALRDVFARQVIFYQDAPHLAVAPVDVVRPLDAEAAHEAAERVEHAERDGLRQQELLAGREERRPARDGEQQVLSPLRLPRVAPLALASGLVFGREHQKLFVGRMFTATDGRIGRIRLFDTDYFEMVQIMFHINDVKVLKGKSKPRAPPNLPRRGGFLLA